jgi:sec-independent protein translocase protein TatA
MEIGIVLIIALIVFGPKKLPDLGHSLGKGLREFKGSLSGETDEPVAQVTEARPLAAESRPVVAEGPVEKTHAA